MSFNAYQHYIEEGGTPWRDIVKRQYERGKPCPDSLNERILDDISFELTANSEEAQNEALALDAGRAEKMLWEEGHYPPESKWDELPAYLHKEMQSVFGNINSIEEMEEKAKEIQETVMQRRQDMISFLYNHKGIVNLDAITTKDWQMVQFREDYQAYAKEMEQKDSQKTSGFEIDYSLEAKLSVDEQMQRDCAERTFAGHPMRKMNPMFYADMGPAEFTDVTLADKLRQKYAAEKEVVDYEFRD